MYLLRLFSQPCSSCILTQARQRAAEQQGVFPRQDVHGVIGAVFRHAVHPVPEHQRVGIGMARPFLERGPACSRNIDPADGGIPPVSLVKPQIFVPMIFRELIRCGDRHDRVGTEHVPQVERLDASLGRRLRFRHLGPDRIGREVRCQNIVTEYAPDSMWSLNIPYVELVPCISDPIDNSNRLSSTYLYPSDSQYITEWELNQYTRDEIVLIRNEIYARYGYNFSDADIRAYFESQSWYHPIDGVNSSTFDSSIFNDYESTNIDTILAYERKMGWR